MPVRATAGAKDPSLASEVRFQGVSLSALRAKVPEKQENRGKKEFTRAGKKLADRFNMIEKLHENR